MGTLVTTIAVIIMTLIAGMAALMMEAIRPGTALLVGVLLFICLIYLLAHFTSHPRLRRFFKD